MIDKQHSNFIFFGTPSVASETLELLESKGITPSLIVTNPDARKGRGLEYQQSDVSLWSKNKSIPVIKPHALTPDVIKNIASYGCNFSIVVAYGKIFPEELISCFKNGVINVHYSLLPKYRGASPVETSIKNGDMTTGVSIQQMVKKLDAGDVLVSREIQILQSDTVRELKTRLIQLGAELLYEVLPCVTTNTCIKTKQNEEEATFASKFKKEDGKLSLSNTATRNWNTYRAFVDSIGTFFFANRNGKKTRVKITHAILKDSKFIIERIIPEGKKEQNYKDFQFKEWKERSI